jgi:hypothetical protein
LVTLRALARAWSKKEAEQAHGERWSVAVLRSIDGAAYDLTAYRRD